MPPPAICTHHSPMLRSGGYEKPLIQAAERGDAEAQFNLAVMYENGLVDNRYVAEGNLARFAWQITLIRQREDQRRFRPCAL